MAQAETSAIDYEVTDVMQHESIGSRNTARKSLPVLPHFDYTPPKYSGPSYDEIKAMRLNCVAPASFAFYREPVLAVDGKM
jgi:hypothetical protein